MSIFGLGRELAHLHHPSPYSYLYEVSPIIGSMDPQEWGLVLDRFSGLVFALANADVPFSLYAVEGYAAGHALDEGPSVVELRQRYMRFFLAAAQAVDGALTSAGLRFSRVLEIPHLRIAAEHGNRMVVATAAEGGGAGAGAGAGAEALLARVLSVWAIPPSTQPGFLSSAYPHAHEVRVDFRPVADPKGEASKRAYNLEGELAVRARSGRWIRPEHEFALRAARDAMYAVIAGSDTLVLARATVTVVGRDAPELRDRTLAVLKALRVVDAPSWLQGEIYGGSAGRWFYMTARSARALFPFLGMDIADPGGVLLGRNGATGNHVIYNPYARDNPHIVVLGATGSGKSMTIKAYLSRFAQEDDEALIYVWDSIVRPEYTEVAKLIGAHAVDLSSGVPDPFAVFSGEPRRALELVAELVEAEGGLAGLLKELPPDVASVALGGGVHSMAELAPHVPALQPYIPYFLPPERKWEVWDRMVFVISTVADARIRDMAAFISLAAAWRLAKGQPMRRKKAFVVDEGWAFVETNPRTGRPYFPAAAEYIPELARTGRHYNSSFLIASQLVRDFAGAGRAVIENAATKVLLHQDAAGLAAVREMLGLTDSEARYILGARPGQGLLITPEGRVPIYVALTEFERKTFSTAPGEVQG